MCDGVHQDTKFEKTLIIDEYIELFLDSGCGEGKIISAIFDELYYDLYHTTLNTKGDSLDKNIISKDSKFFKSAF